MITSWEIYLVFQLDSINSPTVQHEAGYLYKLTKQALENAAAPKPEKQP